MEREVGPSSCDAVPVKTTFSKAGLLQEGRCHWKIFISALPCVEGLQVPPSHKSNKENSKVPCNNAENLNKVNAVLRVILRASSHPLF